MLGRHACGMCSLACQSHAANVKVSESFPSGSEVKNLPANAGDAGDAGLIPGLGISPGEGNDNPLQYSCLGNPWSEGPGRLQSMQSQSRT